jgi:hypothetical protein
MPVENSYKNRAFMNCFRASAYNILVIDQKIKG